MDLPPTFLQASHIKKPTHMQGQALQLLTKGNNKDWQNEVFIQISESQVGRAIRTKKWKYSVRAYDKNGWLHKDSKTYIEDFLYDLESDPYENTNLVEVDEYKRVRKELEEILKKRMIEAGEPIPKILPRTRSNIIKNRLKLPFNIIKWIFTRK